MRAFKSIILLFIAALFGAGWWWQEQAPAVAPMVTFEQVEPILRQHCYECHGDDMDKGEVALDEWNTVEELMADLQLWTGVHNNVEAMLMPPPDEPPLPDEDRQLLTEWIEQVVFQLDPKKPLPGRVTIRRLNREEYRNTMRDLIGPAEFDPASDLPADDTGYGFDNNGDVLSMSPALLEKYVLAADRVLQAHMHTRPPEPERIVRTPREHFKGIKHAADETGMLTSAGTIGVRLKVEQPGRYSLKIRAGANHAGDELPKMELRFASLGKEVHEVKADNDHPEPITREVELKKGDHWLEISFLNDFYDPGNKDPRRRDRNLYIHRVELIGPLDQEIPPPTEFQKQLFAGVSSNAPKHERTREVLRNFVERAWRRPVKDEEVERLASFVSMATDQGDTYESGIQLALKASLVSPNFLFRGEPAVESASVEDRVVQLSHHELATRLSYFLWSSMPDEELRTAADKGTLHRELNTQIDRMLRDPRVSALKRNFAGQWLQLRNLDLVSPDPNQFTSWNEALKDSMRRETELFFETFLTENRSVLDFLDAEFTWLNEPLARHYGIAGIEGAEFRRVSLSESDALQRGGLLGHASILTITSNPTRTSPVMRGKWVMDNLLGTPPPPPAENVPELEEASEGQEGLTLREQLELHREAPLCASCHERMDPIGFGLENYDAIGAWRELESEKPIDSSGELYTGEAFQGPAELREILAGSWGEPFVRHFTETLLTYALGRGVEFRDKPAVNQILESAALDDYRFHAIIHAIVESVPFQYQELPETVSPGALHQPE